MTNKRKIVDWELGLDFEWPWMILVAAERLKLFEVNRIELPSFIGSELPWIHIIHKYFAEVKKKWRIKKKTQKFVSFKNKKSNISFCKTKLLWNFGNRKKIFPTQFDFKENVFHFFTNFERKKSWVAY